MSGDLLPVGAKKHGLLDSFPEIVVVNREDGDTGGPEGKVVDLEDLDVVGLEPRAENGGVPGVTRILLRCLLAIIDLEKRTSNTRKIADKVAYQC